MLTVSHLRCAREDTLVLQDVSFLLPPNTCLAVLGSNGAGKSTLLRALAELLPYQGKITLPEMIADFSRLYLPVQWRGTNVVTVSELLMQYKLMLPPVMRNAGIPEALATFGLERQATQDVLSLSEGQRKRVLLCRLLLQQAHLWLLDEPFDFLDQEGVALLEKIFHNHLHKGGYIILATHGYPSSFKIPIRSLTLQEVKLIP